MQWPWGKPARDEWQAKVHERIADTAHALEQLSAGLERQEELLQQIPRIARGVIRASNTMDALSEAVHQAMSREERRQNEVAASLAVVAEHLMGWVDELDGALQLAGANDPWQEAHEGWLRQLTSLLNRLGFVEIPVYGAPFDPTVAEAVGAIVDNGSAPYTVVQVVQRGYAREGNLWRKAQVVTVRPQDIDADEG